MPLKWYAFSLLFATMPWETSNNITDSFKACLLIILRCGLTHALQKTRLLSFKEHAHVFASILDPHTSPRLDAHSELTLWSMVDYGTMCAEEQLVMPAQSAPAAPAEGEEMRSTPRASLAMEVEGTAPYEMDITSSDQFHPVEMVFDDFDVSSLDYLLDIPLGGGQL